MKALPLTACCEHAQCVTATCSVWESSVCDGSWEGLPREESGRAFRWIMVPVGKVLERERKEHSGRREEVCSLQRTYGRETEPVWEA